MKRFAAILLSAALVFACCGCQRTQEEPDAGLLPENVQEDNVRNWYEIFVYSFADSDGDRIGDLKGAAEKLTYVRDMGFTGIWLMPIMPSPSYHKYDVTDYYAIDPAYGTLEDFTAFLNKAHELGIQVILDLVLNHTSNQHPWFQSAKEGPDSPYRDYYNFRDEPGDGYQQIGDAYYECRFVSAMPDLNLDSPAVREEIVDILEYWLGLGVDGFRLDAVTSYYTGAAAANRSFLSWLNQQAKAIDPDCYLVGECWADESTIAGYYASGIDSFFYFPASTGSGRGEIAKLLDGETENRGQAYGAWVMGIEERFGSEALMAPFLDNHDTDRIANVVGIYDLDRLKAAYGMLAMMRGGTYVYYGGEIGMTGVDNDPNRRIGMYWESLETVTACPPGTTAAKYPLGSVKEQQEDENSLLNYVCAAMNLRNAFPEIARGVTTLVNSADPEVCILERTWEGSTVAIVLNLSAGEKTLSAGYQTLLAFLDANTARGGGVVMEGGALTLDGWGIAIVQ